MGRPLDALGYRRETLRVEKEQPVAAGFEPPKYLASLIAAVNDGAKAAQGGLLLCLLVGLYLLATAFSSSDEDLLLGRTVTIAQIGAALPVSFSFAFAPLVFVFLHVYTLTRFDLLAANLRHFVAELRATVPLPWDREHCLHLLSNVEFVMTLAAEPDSALYDRAWSRMVRALLAVLPVTLLLLVQINSLRYQSQMIRWAQLGWLCADLAALVWFFRRNPVSERADPLAGTVARTDRWSGLRLPLIILGVNVFYLNVVPTDANPRLVFYNPRSSGETDVMSFRWVYDVFRQPLDVLACPTLGLGCRYLRVARRTLVGHVWDDKAMVALRADHPDFATALAGIEGIDLRDRSLRFAVLNESRLYAADLIAADLSHAQLRNSDMPGSKLRGAQLAGADLVEAQLAGADLFEAQLAGADLTWARLAGANLSGAKLAGADLFGAQLAGADLVEAKLAGADLRGAQLAGADLSGAQLAGADLVEAQLAGADLSGAQLAGADLSGAQLAGASVRNARAKLIVSSESTTFASADARGMEFASPLSTADLAGIKADLASIPEGRLKKAAERRLSPVLSGKADPGWTLHFRANKQEQLLVLSRDDPAFKAHPEWLTDRLDDTWREALADRLAADLAGDDPAATTGVARRAAWMMVPFSDQEDCLTGRVIARRLLAAAAATPPGVPLTDAARKNLTDALADSNRRCTQPPTQPGPGLP